jgi:O-antigen ligase
VFAPTLPDGDWVALSAIPGRATGNLRQPNHLSSLLLWSIVAAIWLGEAKVVRVELTTALALVFVYVVVLSASRTGAVGMLTLAGWGLFDRRLSRHARRLLVLAPLIYGAMWWGTTVWATHSHQVFGGQTRFGGGGDISSSRFGIWSNTLALIASHPWFGVGFGDFNFAWSLTPFPGRPVAFFDHTHNIVLNFAVELGVPLALVVLALMLYALWRALANAVADGRKANAAFSVQRAAFVIVILVAVHSMLEYPLWYAYFLLPTAFAFGLCWSDRWRRSRRSGERGAGIAAPYALARRCCSSSAAPSRSTTTCASSSSSRRRPAGPLEQRIADGKKSVLFAHHADYADATIAEHRARS